MISVYLSLGANLGRRKETLQQAVRAISALDGVRLAAVSSFYETPPWGKENQPPFINAAALAETSLPVVEFLRKCQAVETALGRVRHEKWGARTIDIDLVYSPDVTCRTAELTLPHPYLTQRAFVLVPLQEIAPHLTIGETDIGQLLIKLPERRQIIKIE